MSESLCILHKIKDKTMSPKPRVHSLVPKKLAKSW